MGVQTIGIIGGGQLGRMLTLAAFLEAYRTWNMGQGMIGRIVKEPGITLKNKGAFARKEPRLHFDA